MAISGNQLDKLGTRLKARAANAEAVEAEDLRLLDEYRRSFSMASQAVQQVLRDELGLEPTARPAKSTPAIVEKLVRQRIRLAQMQDIAGCRVIVRNLAHQRKVVAQLQIHYPSAQIFDRVEAPSHGYRAVHLVVSQDGRWVEIQVRTDLQHLWAVLSEKTADRFDHGLKYGYGPAEVSDRLMELSDVVQSIESSLGLLELLAERVAQSESAELRDEFANAVAASFENRRILKTRLERLTDDPDYMLSPE